MSFENDLSIADDLKIIINDESRFVTEKLFTRLIFVSPEDTGAFKGNWNVSTGKPDRTIDDSRRSGEALVQGVTVIDSAKDIELPTLTISNGQPYGEKLNSGSSDQAPSMFVELEIQKVKNG